MKSVRLMPAVLFLALLLVIASGCGDPKPQAGNVTGRVLDTLNGREYAVIGATVSIADSEYQTITDENGAYSFDNVPAGTVTVLMEADQYAPAEKDVTVPENEPVIVNLTTVPVQPASHLFANSTDLKEPRGVSTNSISVFVADTNNNRICIFDAVTGGRSTFGSVSATDLNFRMEYPEDVVLDGLNNIYVLCPNNQYSVKEFDASISFVKKWGFEGTATTTTRWYQRAMAWGADGTLYVVGSVDCPDGSGGTVQRRYLTGYNPSTGARVLEPLGPTADGFAGYFAGMAVDVLRGKMYVSEGRRIWCHNIGDASWPAVPFFQSSSHYPAGLYADPKGYLWFADDVGDKLVKLDPQGRVIMEVPLGANTRPLAIDFDNEGRMYVVGGNPRTSATDPGDGWLRRLTW